MDPETIDRLAREHPEGYRGGKVDRGRPVGQHVTTAQAWANARRCLDDDNPARAAYWAGFANEWVGAIDGHVVVTDPTGKSEK